MDAFEKLHLFAVAARPAMLDLIFFLQCLLAATGVLGAVVLYMLWQNRDMLSGRRAREAAICNAEKKPASPEGPAS
jgi:hypothetical protein